MSAAGPIPGALPLNPPKPPTARQKLQANRLRQSQKELMGDDVDLTKFYVAFNNVDLNIEGAVTDIVAQRTIQGASTITATISDREYRLLRSGLLSDQLDTEVDGLYWRLAAVKISANAQLQLVFEDRDIAIARTYDKPIKQALSTSRSRVTRAQFALRLLREIKELPPIPYVIPELNVVQPIGTQAAAIAAQAEKLHNKSFGVPKNNNLLVKNQPMTEEQRRNVNLLLDTGASMVLPRKVLVMGVMAAIQESNLINLRPAFPTKPAAKQSVGILQQIKADGWPATRIIPTDAHEFFKRLASVVASNPGLSYTASIQSVQHSAYPNAYAQWRTEADRIVSAYGVIDGSAADANSVWNIGSGTGTKDYEFYRGRPPMGTYQKKHGYSGWGPESSWDCWQRLANEVQWRAFFVSGTFYFISEDDLFMQQPIATIDGDLVGVDSLSGSYDSNKKGSSLTITCRMGRWAAPPGSVVEIRDMGPWNGRWLVNDVQRSMFNSVGTVTLKKPLPRLPEPATGNVNKNAGGTWTGAPAPTAKPAQTQYHVGTKLVQPVPAGYNTKLVQGYHQTAGLSGYPAADFGGDAGAPVIAVENGVIVRLSGTNPNEGPWDPTLGAHGPFGWSVYLLGDSGTEYFYTHLGSRSVTLNQRVLEGHVIGTVGNYAKWGGVNHTHVGVHPGSSGHPDVYDLMNSPLAAH